MEAKKWYASKTVIANILLLLGILIQAITGTAWLNEEVQAAIIVILNLILRLITKQPLSI